MDLEPQGLEKEESKEGLLSSELESLGGSHCTIKAKIIESNTVKQWLRDDHGILGCPVDSAGKESTCNEGELGLIPGLGRSPG